MIYVTSDLHLSHNREFLYGPRGFASIYEHDLALVKNWNKIVKEEDTVYVLGDLMLNDNKTASKMFKQLNGKIVLVYGNHDTVARQELYKTFHNIEEIKGYATTLKYKGYNLYLSHYPTLTANKDEEKPLKAKVISICGHTHTQDKFEDMDKGLIYHVELDAHDMKPVSLDTIIEDIENYIIKEKKNG